MRAIVRIKMRIYLLIHFGGKLVQEDAMQYSFSFPYSTNPRSHVYNTILVPDLSS